MIRNAACVRLAKFRAVGLYGVGMASAWCCALRTWSVAGVPSACHRRAHVRPCLPPAPQARPTRRDALNRSGAALSAARAAGCRQRGGNSKDRTRTRVLPRRVRLARVTSPSKRPYISEEPHPTTAPHIQNELVRVRHLDKGCAHIGDRKEIIFLLLYSLTLSEWKPLQEPRVGGWDLGERT